ncbi:hypothetical protein [Edaphovirga cremea]|uniref:hypothetical protein n=1 Tax=Edaphovirga cremea TaxID=2267246 RepID=UPI003989FAF0
MKICFPVRKQSGSEYSSLEEVMGLIGREPHGSWLAGTNQLWHGGIHVSQVSAPGSVLTADSVDTAVPLRCMAKGEVVAWRLNQDHKRADYNGKELRYSSTFVLVKSTCKPAPEKENSWLEFYSLYMGLAPLSAFPKAKCFKAKTDVRKRAAGNFENSASSDGIPAAPAKSGELKKDTRVIVHKQKEFRNGGAVQPFGLAKMLNASGEASGDAFWVTLLPEFMEPDGEQYAQMPVWMQKAVNQGMFDSVTKPAATLEIEAGDAIGFLGEDIAPAGKSQVNTCHYAHIEVISTDSRMPAFLNNPAGITSGQKFVRLHADADLYAKSGEGELRVFTKTTSKTEKDSGKILRVTDCSPFEDAQHKTWYKISDNSWMSQDDVDQLNQYDLKELGFTTLEEEASQDVSKSLRENWVKGAYDWLSEQVGKERGIQQKQVSAFYKNLVKKIDADGDGELSGKELYNALHHPELGLRDIAARLVVKHDSEWFGGSRHHRWSVFFQNYDRLRMAYAKQWLDDCEWMSQVDAFKSGKPVWHFHPVMFLNALNNALELINVDAFLAMYESEHVSFAPVTLNLSQGSKNNLRKLLKSINDFYSISSEYKPNLYRLSYMLATARHETYHFTTGEYFSEQPEVGSVSYFNKYDPVLAETQSWKNRAVANGNTHQGDGFKYRGRGCVHLTWKNNYQKAKEKYGADFVSHPDLAGDFKYAVPIMVWGMEDGIFTGKKISSYINGSGVDYESARKVINGNDQKVLIASYANKFQSILENTSSAPKEF